MYKPLELCSKAARGFLRFFDVGRSFAMTCYCSSFKLCYGCWEVRGRAGLTRMRHAAST